MKLDLLRFAVHWFERWHRVGGDSDRVRFRQLLCTTMAHTTDDRHINMHKVAKYSSSTTLWLGKARLVRAERKYEKKQGLS